MRSHRAAAARPRRSRRRRPAPALRVDGFAGDTIVRAALEALAAARGSSRLDGSADEADSGRGGSRRRQLRRRHGAAARERDVARAAPSRRASRPCRDARIRRSVLPRERPAARRPATARAHAARSAAGLLGAAARSRTASEGVDRGCLRGFDERDGAVGFEERRARCSQALAARPTPQDLATFPPNDLASSPLRRGSQRLGAFRADVDRRGPGGIRALPHRATLGTRHARCGAAGPRPFHGACWYG